MIAERRISTQTTPFCDYDGNGLHHNDRSADLGSALGACLLAGIEVVSLLPEWVEFRVPCSLKIISPLQELLTQLDADLPQEMSEAISYAFREMLSNAVEYGGRFDPAARVEVRFVRLKRAVVCRIKDPASIRHCWTMPRLITRITIRFTMPQCVKRRA